MCTDQIYDFAFVSVIGVDLDAGRGMMNSKNVANLLQKVCDSTSYVVL